MGTMIYNGVELPDIEAVWTDKTTYPYVYIRRIGARYTLALLTTPFYVNVSGDTMYWSADGSGVVHNAAIDTDADPWEVADWVFDRNFTYSYKGWNSGPTEIPIIWANFDIYDVNGALYAATSDPVKPAQPEHSYDRTAFLSGLAAGLTGRGDPVFAAAADTFAKGYLAGAELRRKRVIS